MRDPSDEFARYFRKLRKDRGYAADKLSHDVGMKSTYIGKWERGEITTINKGILAKVCDALSLSDAERAELFRLADRRILHDEKIELRAWPDKYNWPGQRILNVNQVLQEADNQFLQEMVSNDTLEQFIECASWVLANYAAHEMDEFSPFILTWPGYFYWKGILPDEYQGRKTSVAIPDEIIHQELPNIGLLVKGQITSNSAQYIGQQMASAYRRWLLSDLERCRLIVQRLARWSLSIDPRVGKVVRFFFKKLDEEKFNVPGVRLEVATPIVRRNLIHSLWQHNRLPAEEWHTYPHPHETIDADVYPTYRMARLYLQGVSEVQTPFIKQSIKDARYTVRSVAWKGSDFLISIAWNIRDMSQAMRDDADPVPTKILNSQNPRFCESLNDMKNLMIDTLESSVRRMTEENEEEKTEPTPPAGGKRPKAGQKRKV